MWRWNVSNERFFTVAYGCRTFPLDIFHPDILPEVSPSWKPRTFPPQICAHRWYLISKLLVGPTPPLNRDADNCSYCRCENGIAPPRLFRVRPNCFDVAFRYSRICPPRFTTRTSCPSAPNYLVSQVNLNITCRLYSLIICSAHSVKTTPLNFSRTQRQELFCAPLHIVLRSGISANF